MPKVTWLIPVFVIVILLIGPGIRIIAVGFPVGSEALVKFPEDIVARCRIAATIGIKISGYIVACNEIRYAIYSITHG